MSDQPLANDPTARTETGELKDQAGVSQTDTTQASTDTTKTAVTDTTKPEPETKPAVETKPSLLNDKTVAPEGAPEAYTPFTVPEGYELNTEVATEAQTLFKKHNLSQAQGQELVDFYTKQITSVAEAPYKAFDETNAEWQRQTLADPELGPHIGKVKETISRALDSIGDAKMTAAFKEVMDLTGAGNHPAFVKAFYKLAIAATEGKHVSGKGPSALGQTAPGSKPASIANAMYPNLG